MSTSYIYFIIFFCVAYLIVTDQSVAKAFYMLSQLARVEYEKIKWWIFYMYSIKKMYISIGGSQ